MLTWASYTHGRIHAIKVSFHFPAIQPATEETDDWCAVSPLVYHIGGDGRFFNKKGRLASQNMTGELHRVIYLGNAKHRFEKCCYGVDVIHEENNVWKDFSTNMISDCCHSKPVSQPWRGNPSLSCTVCTIHPCQRDVDCYTSDIGRWFAMTKIRRFPS